MCVCVCGCASLIYYCLLSEQCFAGLLCNCSARVGRWYFPDTKRLDAEKMLQAEGNRNGAFLIRDCESQRGELSLSGETGEDEEEEKEEFIY